MRPGGRALGRAYLITEEQFADVLAQENWLDPGSVGIDGCEGMYGVVLTLGSIDGHEIRTITQPPDTSLNAPSDRYVKHIVDGLREAYGMSDEAIAEYLGLR